MPSPSVEPRAGRALRRWLALLGLSAVLGVGAAPPETPAETQAVLERMHEAVRQKSFQGTFVVSSGGVLRSTRISHYNVGGQQYQRIETLDGLRCEVFRHNEQVHTLWPSIGKALIEERRGQGAAFPALIDGGVDALLRHYTLRETGSERVAGHEARVIELRPRDGLRFAHRLWVERRSGLLLRADVLGEDGQVLESAAFSEVQIGIKPQPELVLGPMKQLDGYRVLRSRISPVALDGLGWTLQELPPGFRHVSSLRRPLERPPVAAPMAAAASGPAGLPGGPVELLQTIYSDGLTHVSIFIEPFDPRLHRRELMVATGATQTLVRRQGDWWITVVGDVPVPTLQAFAAGLERRR